MKEFNLTSELRADLIEFLVHRYLENMSTRDLERFYLDTQSEYLSGYSNEELLDAVEDYSTDDEFNDFRRKLLCD